MKWLGYVATGLVVLGTFAGCDLSPEKDVTPSPGEPIPGTERQIKNNDGRSIFELETYPRLSPDGKTIAYNWDDGTFGSSIYLQDVGSTERHFLVKGGKPDWSPDGQWLTFFSDGYNIAKASVDGKEVVQLTSEGESLEPAWSPDGKTIAFYMETFDANTAGIATVNVNGSKGGRLFLGGMPDWFPDGRLFASLGNINSFLVYDRKTARLDTIPGMPDQVRSPQVSPDGTRIAFLSLSSGIWLCDADGSDLHLIVHDDLSKYSTGNPKVRVGAPSWHPDGRHIIFEFLKITRFVTTDIGNVIDGDYSIRIMDVGPAT